MKIAIIGAGASGTIAALKLKELNKNIEVKIFDREKKILGKVLRSGGGRCNFGNMDINPNNYTNSNIVLKMKEYLEQNKLSDSNTYLKELGLLTESDSAGRLYPLSYDSKSICMFLEQKLFFSGVKLELESNINNIVKKNDKYLINDELFDKVIISIGSNASLNYDFNNQYALINNLNLELNNLKPGLVGFKIKDNIKELSGIRAKVKASLDNKESIGEVNFKDNGISGICIMDLSNYYEKQKYLSLNLLSDFTFDDLLNNVDKMFKSDPSIRLHSLFLGSINSKILNYINKKYDNKKVSDTDFDTLKKYILEFTNFKLEIDSLYDYKDAQIITGGVSLDDLDFFKVKDEEIYITGEVLDNAGICGGYNLWFAMTSGIIVANMIGGLK